MTPITLAAVFSMYKFWAKRFIFKLNSTPYIKSLVPKVFWFKMLAILTFTLIHELIYGGDTINYTKRGGGVIYRAFGDDPLTALQVIFLPDYNNFKHLSIINQMVFDYNQREALIIKICAICSLLTFDSYLSIDIILSTFALSGLWAIYLIFNKLHPNLNKKFAFAFFYIPSLTFWSAGVLKEPLAIGAMGWMFYSLYGVFFNKSKSPYTYLLLILSFLILKEIKIYIILCFMPALIFWLFIQKTKTIKNLIVRKVFTPLFFISGILGAFYAANIVTQGDKQYDISKIAETSKATSEYLLYLGKTQNASAYDLGSQDGTFGGMLRLAGPAINVALFRPYPWESRNITMFVSSLESLFFLFLTLKILIKVGIIKTFSIIAETPLVLFCFVFSVAFAFAVGISSYNFGTLVRYKIPFLPFYLSGLYIMEGFISKKYKKKIL